MILSHKGKGQEWQCEDTLQCPPQIHLLVSVQQKWVKRRALGPDTTHYDIAPLTNSVFG